MFKPGDRIRYTGSRTPFLIGEEGIVTGVIQDSVRVDWDYPQPKAAPFTSACNITNINKELKYNPNQMVDDDDDL